MRRLHLLPILAALTLLLVALSPVPAEANANISIVNLDAGTGQGLDDPTPVAPVGGNPGTTLGQQRLNVFLAAANIWGSAIDSTQTIFVDATFTPLQCNAFSAVLGAAGAQTVHANFPGAPQLATWYHQALANSLSNSDLDPATNDLIAFFNSSIDNNNNCLNNTDWYLGFDSNPPGSDIDFFTVVLHEIGHGLGFSSFVDESTGALLAGQHDIWNSFLFDATTGLTWRQMNNAQRAASAINTGNLTWQGPRVTAEAPGFAAGVNGATGFLQMYAPNPVEPGSSVSHYDTAVTPNVLMEPFITNSTTDLDITVPLFADIGWSTDGYRLSNPIPGFPSLVNDFTTEGATPGQTTFFIYGFNPGARAVPGCPGVFADINDINIFSSGPANAAGEYAVSPFIPAIGGATVLFQSVELSTCSVSNLVSYTWP
ncbi:MAG: hypothetical protein AAGD01_03280 [Acidobacteriota bacterium]